MADGEIPKGDILYVVLPSLTERRQGFLWGNLVLEPVPGASVGWMAFRSGREWALISLASRRGISPRLHPCDGWEPVSLALASLPKAHLIWAGDPDRVQSQLASWPFNPVRGVPSPSYSVRYWGTWTGPQGRLSRPWG